MEQNRETIDREARPGSESWRGGWSVAQSRALPDYSERIVEDKLRMANLVEPPRGLFCFASLAYAGAARPLAWRLFLEITFGMIALIVGLTAVESQSARAGSHHVAVRGGCGLLEGLKDGSLLVPLPTYSKQS
jgi:hypothetical protein